MALRLCLRIVHKIRMDGCTLEYAIYNPFFEERSVEGYKLSNRTVVTHNLLRGFDEIAIRISLFPAMLNGFHLISHFGQNHRDTRLKTHVVWRERLHHPCTGFFHYDLYDH